MQYVAVLFCYTSLLINIKLCTKFQNPKSSRVAEKSLTKKSLERNKNEDIKGLKSNMWLFLLYHTTHHYQALCHIAES